MGLNRKQTAQAIGERKAFTNSTGSLRGFTGPWLGTGQLNDVERQRFLSDARQGIDYLVVSYSTPIAWVVGDAVYKVSQKLSQTTSCHMGLTYML